MEKHPLHLKNPELQSSPEVERAVERKERQGDTVPNDPAERIGAYMDRLENIFLNPKERTRKRNLELFREKIYDKLLIKKEHFPESYFELQKRIARERGQAVEEIPESVRQQMMEVAIEDQKASLDAWIDYLTSNDAVYPAWFKYFIWRNITKLSQFDKERGEFKKRTDTTVAAYYEQGKEGNAQRLFQSLEGKGTGWCTAGHSTAEAQVENGDFHVYYTNDMQGEPTQPRLAIRMQGKQIGEVRGILPHQGVEPVMQDTLDAKLTEFGGEADLYRKKSQDMRMVTALNQKRENNQPFTKDDLLFLYEINSPIQGFGYQKDPRIEEMRSDRDIKTDLAYAMGIEEKDISLTPEEALKGNILFHYGHLDLHSLTSAEIQKLKKQYPNLWILQ